MNRSFVPLSRAMAGLYVHLPFCRVRCTYCPFAISTDHSHEERYVDSLLGEIENRARGEEVATVYFGGGTPSRTSLVGLQRVVESLKRQFALAADLEFSLEANPEDVTGDSLAGWRALGVNRVSLGVQSLHDDELIPLGRVHGRSLAIDAVERTVAAGFRTNLDLILGLPNQTRESFRSTLAESLRLGAGHLSLYMLDLEEGTKLAEQVVRGSRSLPDDGKVSDAYKESIETMAAAGLIQYEISNFARPGEECRHNLGYWQREPYFGFGLGAHSFLGKSREANTTDIGGYIDELAAGRSPLVFSEILGDDENEREEIFLALRQTRGIRGHRLVEIRGDEGARWIEQGLGEGWLARDDDSVALTTEGFLLSNEFISRLF